MQSLKKIRESLGLSQIQMSTLLGISGGLVALVETGKRNLPESSRQLVLELGKRLALQPPIESETTFDLDKAGRDWLEKEIRTKTRKMNQLSLKLEACQMKLDQLHRLKEFSEQLEADRIWPEGSIEKDAWTLLVRKNFRKMFGLSRKAIALKINIEGLRAELEESKILLKNQEDSNN